ncbi:hypothetical protein HF984_00770 [Rothia terrae]|uniref:LpqB family beta-propeller domain-containing protein n=1 Tax=Rothia terrae TaxID=396015 RepID=UPI001444F706|nr:LpqB family beta-propeller domain-containing protein [Rothia terrae]MDT0189132.1 LpqB family beta-propeller domain-containing protein [Rothia terrae]NKZ33317.1 hypothetical protein [Rothia terrae]
MAKLSRLTVITVSSVALLALNACAGIPTSGSVNHYADPRATASSTSESIEIDGPAGGASPEEIIRGFLNAGVGVRDDYKVAREFLTDDYAQSWAPDDHTVVYSDQPSITNSSGDSYKVSVPATSEIDDRGIATSFNANETKNLEFELKRVDGNWRISSAPGEIVLQQNQFDQVYNPFTLYFFDPTYSYAVPDVRWFADRDTVATSLIRVLLQGPAPYLKDAVVSAVPEGTKLTRNSVPVDGGTADIDISGDGISNNLSQLTIERINAQMNETLTSLANINSVKLLLNGQAVQTGTLSEANPIVDPSVPDSVIGTEDGSLVTRSQIDDPASQSTVYTPQGANATLPAMGIARGIYSYLSEDRKNMWLVRNGEAQQILTGNDLSQPSFDYLHWAWVAHDNSTISVVSSTAENPEPEDLEVPWLNGYSVHSINISRGGSRAVLTGTDGTYSYVWVSGVIRGKDGKPTGLQEPVRIGTSIIPDYADFTSDQEIVVANYEEGTAEIVSLSGISRSLEPLKGLTKLTVGGGDNQIMAETKDSTLYRLTSSGWTRVESSMHDFNYSG